MLHRYLDNRGMPKHSTSLNQPMATLVAYRGGFCGLRRACRDGQAGRGKGITGVAERPVTSAAIASPLRSGACPFFRAATQGHPRHADTLAHAIIRSSVGRPPPVGSLSPRPGDLETEVNRSFQVPFPKKRARPQDRIAACLRMTHMI